MNCRPGDLAYVFRKANQSAHHQHLLPLLARALMGRVVRVVKLIEDEDGDPVWQLERPIELDFCIVDAMDDAMLRPIRDPGDDVADPRDVKVDSIRAEDMQRVAESRGLVRLPVREMTL